MAARNLIGIGQRVAPRAHGTPFVAIEADGVRAISASTDGQPAAILGLLQRSRLAQDILAGDIRHTEGETRTNEQTDDRLTDLPISRTHKNAALPP